MKKISLTMAIGLLLILKLEAKPMKGIIIYDNDTAEVTFNIPVALLSQEPNYEKLQHKVKYVDSLGKKRVLRPDDAKEIQFNYANQTIRMLSRINTFGAGKIFSSSSNLFLKLEIDGALQLFNYYFKQNSPGILNASGDMMTAGHTYSVEKYILQKHGGVMKRPKEISFRKDMTEYFSDCPKLSSMIEKRTFRKNDLKSIVIYYNSNCL